MKQPIYTIQQIIDKGVATLLNNTQWVKYVMLINSEAKMNYLKEIGVLSQSNPNKLGLEFNECHV